MPKVRKQEREIQYRNPFHPQGPTQEPLLSNIHINFHFFFHSIIVLFIHSFPRSFVSSLVRSLHPSIRFRSFHIIHHSSFVCCVRFVSPCLSFPLSLSLFLSLSISFGPLFRFALASFCCWLTSCFPFRFLVLTSKLVCISSLS